MGSAMTHGLGHSLTKSSILPAFSDTPDRDATYQHPESVQPALLWILSG